MDRIRTVENFCLIDVRPINEDLSPIRIQPSELHAVSHPIHHFLLKT